MLKIYGYIYLIKNLYNNKVYIGQTKIIKKRINHHFNCIFNNKLPKSYIHNAIYKYGKHNFTWKILGTCNSKQELNEAEITCIEFFQSNDKRYGYNLTKGGEGLNYPSKETREKISKALKNKPLTEETKRKLSEKAKNRKHSEETKNKISKSMSGINNPHYGKHMSDETKEKLRKINTGKHRK